MYSSFESAVDKMANAKKGEDRKYPDSVIEKLREAKGLAPTDTSRDALFNTWTENEVMEALLNYEGIVGYWYHIKSMIELVYNINLEG